MTEDNGYMDVFLFVCIATNWVASGTVGDDDIILNYYIMILL